MRRRKYRRHVARLTAAPHAQPVGTRLGLATDGRVRWTMILPPEQIIPVNSRVRAAYAPHLPPRMEEE